MCTTYTLQQQHITYDEEDDKDFSSFWFLTVLVLSATGSCVLSLHVQAHMYK